LFAWGQQLARVAYALRPDSLAAQLLMARALLRQGERDEALRRLEDIREAKPSGADEQDAWYRCCQLLGDLYLQEFARPDLAVACLKDFKPCPFSGADTDFRLGQAYESLGDKPRALRAYEQVTIYTNHPLYYDATQAVRRLKESV
jgi:predicted Zn-dependent protease